MTNQERVTSIEEEIRGFMRVLPTVTNQEMKVKINQYIIDLSREHANLINWHDSPFEAPEYTQADWHKQWENITPDVPWSDEHDPTIIK